MLYDLFKRKWFGSRSKTITQIDLQSREWKLCAPDCEDCNCKSKAFRRAVNRGIDRIADFLPTRKMPNPHWPDGPPPKANTAVKEEAKEESELPAGSQRGTKRIRALDGPKPKVKVKDLQSREERDKEFLHGHKSDRIILCDPASIDKEGLAEARAEQLKKKEDKRAKEEAKAEELKARLARRTEQFAAGRQSGVEDARMRARIEASTHQPTVPKAAAGRSALRSGTGQKCNNDKSCSLSGTETTFWSTPESSTSAAKESCSKDNPCPSANTC